MHHPAFAHSFDIAGLLGSTCRYSLVRSRASFTVGVFLLFLEEVIRKGHTDDLSRSLRVRDGGVDDARSRLDLMRWRIDMLLELEARPCMLHVWFRNQSQSCSRKAPKPDTNGTLGTTVTKENAVLFLPLVQNLLIPDFDGLLSIN